MQKATQSLVIALVGFMAIIGATVVALDLV